MTVQTESTRKRTADRKRTAASDTATVAPPEKTKEAPETRRSAPNRSRTAAAQRAYARRAQREGRPIVHRVDDDLDRGTGRASFAVLIIVVLTVGVAATLWLSTQAIADSYRLDQTKQEADRLAERAAQLQREVTEQESAASLAERAKAMGMIPAGDPARLIVQPDGTVVLVGEPTPVQPPAPTPPTGDQTQNGTATGAGAGTGAEQPANGQQSGGTGQGAG
jgi:hypothetical protein